MTHFSNLSRRKFVWGMTCTCGTLLLPSCADVAMSDRKQFNILSDDFLYSKTFPAYENFKSQTKLITGTLEFLNWCKNNSISMAVCTNKQEHLSIDLLKKIKIYHFFDYVAGGNTFNYNKPNPKHLTDTLEVIEGNIKKTIMVGDSETDSNAAKAANIPFVLIEGGYTEKKISEIYHDHLVKNFLGLEKIIEKYL